MGNSYLWKKCQAKKQQSDATLGLKNPLVRFNLKSDKNYNVGNLLNDGDCK